MHSSKKELLEALERIKGIPVLVVGDIILDRYIWGHVDRISPEAPVPVVDVKRVEDRLGGAGNVVRNLRGIGASVSLCGFIGDDDEGRIVLNLLEDLDVLKDGTMIDRTRPTCLKTRVIAHSQQVVRIDREERILSASPLKEALSAVVDSQIDASKAVIISDYGKGAVSETLMKKFDAAKKKGRVGYGIRPVVLDPKPANFDIYAGITVAKPNRKEAEWGAGMKISSPEDALTAAKILKKRWGADLMLITLGEDGLVIVPPSEKDEIVLDTVAQEVYDVSGAGDTVTALFTAAIASGSSPRVAGDLANVGAGVVVSEVGTVSIDATRLKEELDRIFSSGQG